MFTESELSNYYLATLCAALWLSVSTCERAYEAHSMHEGLFVYLVVYTEEKDVSLMSEERVLFTNTQLLPPYT